MVSVYKRYAFISGLNFLRPFHSACCFSSPLTFMYPLALSVGVQFILIPSGVSFWSGPLYFIISGTYLWS